jgi:hypothetical protein
MEYVARGDQSEILCPFLQVLRKMRKDWPFIAAQIGIIPPNVNNLYIPT